MKTPVGWARGAGGRAADVSGKKKRASAAPRAYTLATSDCKNNHGSESVNYSPCKQAAMHVPVGRTGRTGKSRDRRVAGSKGNDNVSGKQQLTRRTRTCLYAGLVGLQGARVSYTQRASAARARAYRPDWLDLRAKRRRLRQQHAGGSTRTAYTPVRWAGRTSKRAGRRQVSGER